MSGVLCEDHTMTDALDTQLLQQVAQQRSDAAFDALTDRWREPLRRHLLRLTSDAASAEDLLQETFLRIWTHAQTFDGRSEPRSWAFRIAGNLASNARRSCARRREDFPEGESVRGMTGFDAFAGNLPRPEDALLRTETTQRLRHAIDSLDDDRRELIRLVYDEDWPLAAVAGALGVPTGTVKSRLFHTRRTLAQTLKQEEK